MLATGGTMPRLLNGILGAGLLLAGASPGCSDDDYGQDRQVSDASAAVSTAAPAVRPRTSTWRSCVASRR